MTDEVLPSTLKRLIDANPDLLDDEEALAMLGQLIDASGALQYGRGLDRAFEVIETIKNRDLAPGHWTLLHYFEGNAWSSRTQMRSSAGGGAWSWEAEDLAGKILAYLRLSNAYQGKTPDGRPRWLV